MQSHTVPRKLLDQFAYDDPVTKSRRLWQYAKGREPWGKASPKTATRVNGQFSDPEDAEKEAQLEHRLNRGFETPVNEFIEQLGFRTFVFSPLHVRQLTAYVSLLFHRSKARRAATQQQLDIAVESYTALLANEDQLSQIAGKWTLDVIREGHALQRTISVTEVRAAITQMLNDQLAEGHLQHTYAGTMERAMARLDEDMVNGLWRILYTEPENPFVIGDAPVVTWERNERNFLIHGQGFGKPDVEAFLPVSPKACLHILPRVRRTRIVSPQLAK